MPQEYSKPKDEAADGVRTASIILTTVAAAIIAVVNWWDPISRWFDALIELVTFN